MRTFDIVLTGKTLPGFEANSAATALASMLRVPADKARELLAGRETVIKRGLAEDQLPPYVEALRKCGAEVRAREPVPDKLKCPACGTEQPQRNLCVSCGADMKRVAEAQAVAKAPPRVTVGPVSSAAKVAAPARDETPYYRRSLLTEMLFFFFLTPYYGWKLMTDWERGKIANVFGAIVLVASSVQIFLLVNEIRKYGWMGEDAPVVEAVRFAGVARRQVEDFAVANRRLPERGELRVVGEFPESVDSVEVGPSGRVRVVLGAEVKLAPGGAIVLTPSVDGKGYIGWECHTVGVKTWLGPSCPAKQ
jgi:hypothetical protein